MLNRLPDFTEFIRYTYIRNTNRNPWNNATGRAGVEKSSLKELVFKPVKIWHCFSLKNIVDVFVLRKPQQIMNGEIVNYTIYT